MALPKTAIRHEKRLAKAAPGVAVIIVRLSANGMTGARKASLGDSEIPHALRAFGSLPSRNPHEQKDLPTGDALVGPVFRVFG